LVSNKFLSEKGRVLGFTGTVVGELRVRV